MLNAFSMIGTRVNIRNPRDIIKYTEEWHITQEVLRTAISKVGFLKSDIANWLTENGFLEQR